MKKRIRSALPVLFFSILSSCPTFAATIHVPADRPSIQAGINAAVEGDTVRVAPGVYSERIDFCGKAITVQSDAGAEVTIIDGGHDGTVVTFSSGEPAETVLEGFTIRNGYAWYGAGIYCRNSSPTIENCRISDNSADVDHADAKGGGIYCYDNSSPTIRGCTITGNSTSDDGGGIALWSYSDAVITNCSIYDNRARNGGGIFCSYNCSPTIANCTISENTAGYGGGISLFNSCDPTIENCLISYNSGGGIYWNGSSPTITNCTFNGNSSRTGGGIYCSDTSDSTITHCTFVGNSAESGGAIYGGSRAYPTIKNCTITANVAEEYGGGVCSAGSNLIMANNIITDNAATYGGGLSCTKYYTSPGFINCVFHGNHADQGGGFYCNQANPRIQCCILWENDALEGPEGYVVEGTPSVSYSDVQGGWPGTANIHEDPLFIGGGDFHLHDESPCIDAGKTNPSYDDLCFPPSKGGDRNDMGAYGGPDACGWCEDSDGDGQISAGCLGPDCDDDDPTIYSGAPEICDGNDSDCDGIVPEDEADDDGDGWRICEGDCDDGNPEVNPVHPEVPGNGIDDDCDGLTDEPPAAIHVPGDAPTIQLGIVEAMPGEIVLVAPGTYVENLIFADKDITIRSEAGARSTVIDGNQAGSVLMFDRVESEGAAVEGFTIRNGKADYGGGIYCYSSCPKIAGCIVTDNIEGGGIYCSSSSPEIMKCVIKNNMAFGTGAASEKGGGICLLDCSYTTITNCTIAGNTAEWNGGGIYCKNSSHVTIANCTIAGNNAVCGGGMQCDYAEPTITNCIIWDNLAKYDPGINTHSESFPLVTYCDVQGGWSGPGNIELDPLFVGRGNYRLTFDSPCIDAGTAVDVPDDLDGEGRPQGAGFDMGSDEYPDCRDGDEDGYGDAACGGYDCDDTIPSVNPGVKEICTGGADEDCDGLVDSDDPDCVTIRVPAHKPTIQAAIDAAVHGNRILVAPGTYKEITNFLGKNITLQSEGGADATVIDGKSAGSVVTFSERETKEAVIDGFTIRNGLADYGGGIYCLTSSPTIMNCTITGNQKGHGIYCGKFCSPSIVNCTLSENRHGGISSTYSSLCIDTCIINGNHGAGIQFSDGPSITISNCVIKENRGIGGGGIDCNHSSPIITNCTITGNFAEGEGGGLHCWYQDRDSTPMIMNCTISGNIAPRASGMYCYSFSPVIKNSILWGNSVYFSLGNPPDITYSNVMGGWEGEGNIDENPLFVGLGDYHLAAGSPCIDSGTDTGVCTDIEGDVRPHGDGFDMGSDEFTWGLAKLPFFVPLRFPSIQAFIDAAGPGDTCFVLPGVYHENIDFKGKVARIEGLLGPDSTVIEGNQLGPVVDFSTSETEGSVIDGFTIRKGAIYGGIRCYDSSPMITNCRIAENSAFSGGGLHCVRSSSPKITNCTIENNMALAGGGVYFDDTNSSRLTNCTIRDNIAFWGGGIFYINLYVCAPLDIINCVIAGNQAALGGGVYGIGYSTTITNCTIAENSATMKGGGIRCYYSNPEVTNSILWGDSSPLGPEIALTNKSRLDISYSDVQGGEWRAYVSPNSTLRWFEGNINIIPLFAGGGDYLLLPLSPCIDAGTDAGIYTDMDGQARPFGNGFDMGADEYRPGGCQVLIVPTSHVPIALFLFPALALIFLGRRFSGMQAEFLQVFFLGVDK